MFGYSFHRYCASPAPSTKSPRGSVCLSTVSAQSLARPLVLYCLTVVGTAVSIAAPAVQAAHPQENRSPQDRPTVEERKSRETAKLRGEITFDDLKFDIEKGGKFERSMITENIEELNKKTLQIRGYILPASVFKQTGIEEFVLVRDNMECCFGPGAALYDCIIVQMEKGKFADFSTRPIAVKGKFEIKEFKYPDSEDHYAIYKMTAVEAK